MYIYIYIYIYICMYIYTSCMDLDYINEQGASHRPCFFFCITLKPRVK